MIKPDSLRQLLTDQIEFLKLNPDKLKIYVRGGGVALRYSAVNLGYQYKYRLSVEVRDFIGNPDDIFIPVTIWLRTNQPDLLLNHDKADDAVSFEVDILDNETIDLDITMNLTESLDVLRDGAGYKVRHRPEPQLDDGEIIVDPAALLKRIYDQDAVLIVGRPPDDE